MMVVYAIKSKMSGRNIYWPHKRYWNAFGLSQLGICESHKVGQAMGPNSLREIWGQKSSEMGRTTTEVIKGRRVKWIRGNGVIWWATPQREGYGRYTPADRKKFYLCARGSFEETKAWLRKALRRKVISLDEEAAKYKEIVEELGPKLNAFIKTTKQ
jgi:hypothetical protein